MRILAADVGGTKSLLALYEGEPGALRSVKEARYASGDHAGIASILIDFLGGDGHTIDGAALAVAGPVVGGVCRTTNLPWQLHVTDIARDVGLSKVHLFNDFEAVAMGIGELGTSELAVLQEREADPTGPVAILGAGTGLGEAILIPSASGELPRVLPTEGGHTDFGPRDALEIELLRWLLTRFDRVSYERLLSGSGVELLYEFVVSRGLSLATEAVAARVASAEDGAAVIGEAAMKGTDPACVRALEMFVSILGAEAGNLALKTLPRGGVYVAGGIAPKILRAITSGPFMSSFLAKGRMRPLLEQLRVSVVLNSHVGLLGARRVATTLAQAS
jgi:glucokinase